MTPGKRLREVGLNAGLTIISLVVFFGLVEGLARLGGYAPYPAQADVFRQEFDQSHRASISVFTPNPVRIWDLTPGFQGHREDWQERSWVTISINSQGRRDSEVPLAKPAGTYRIALVGDSVAFGARVQVQDDFATRLEASLNARSTSLRYEVLNFGVPGYGTWQELSMLEDKALAYQPDLVLLAFVVNDLSDNNQAGRSGYLNMTRVQGVARFMRENSAFYRFMREKLLSAEAQLALRDPCVGADQTYCWETTRQLLDQMLELVRRRHVKFALIVFPTREQTSTPDPRLEARYQRVLADYARAQNIPAIDLLDVFTQHNAQDLFIDSYHPTEIGHALAANAILEQLDALGLLPRAE